MKIAAAEILRGGDIFFVCYCALTVSSFFPRRYTV